ncbi:MAG: glycosyltransferase family 2 protein [Acidobacteriota bacterium]|nr:glycosyltransferase family 2 protein [Acidobacteriota bacterium]
MSLHSHPLKTVVSYILFTGVIFGPPLLLIISISNPWIYAVILLFINSILILIVLFESISAIWAPISNGNYQSKQDKSISVIVSAYLPNEEAIILNTLGKLVAFISPDSRDEIILSYRTPYNLPIEFALQEFAKAQSCLRLLKVSEGIGKADQLNEALKYVTGDIVYMLDADAIPDNDALARVRSASVNGHVIQGRNMIRNTSHLIGKVVAVEFAVKYMVSHFARSHYGNVAYFCGSNATWIRETAQTTLFTNDSLIEDVEASARADLAGLRILINPTIAATELAPVSLMDWWRQRRRWSQGWLDVGNLHFKAILTQPSFSLWKKINWTYVIYVRRTLYGLVTFWMLFLMIYLGLNADARGYLMLIGYLCLQLISGLIQSTAVAVQCLHFRESRIRPLWLIMYSLLYPSYDLLKNAVAISALAESGVGRRSWSVTPRPAT